MESFNGRLRDECLSLHWFLGLKEAREEAREVSASSAPGVGARSLCSAAAQCAMLVSAEWKERTCLGTDLLRPQANGGQSTARDPSLDGPHRYVQLPGNLSRRQAFVGHGDLLIECRPLTRSSQVVVGSRRTKRPSGAGRGEVEELTRMDWRSADREQEQTESLRRLLSQLWLLGPEGNGCAERTI